MLDKFLFIERYNSHVSSTLLILVSLLAGIGTGLLLGEYVARLRIVGDVYIGLLQMTVLPYMLFALIANIGRLDYAEARLLIKYGFWVLALLWLIGCLAVWVMSMALPPLNSGAFFSTLLTQSPPDIDFFKLFIPSNPFQSLADNSVPAVVVFSLLFGMACIGFKEHESLMEHCDHVAKVLLRVNSFVVMLSPIGVFAIAAHAAGTLTLEQFGQVKSYILMLIIGVIWVTFVILPLLIMSCTPFTYGQIMKETRNILLTVFVVGSVFIVIPLLTRSITRLFHGHVATESENARLPDMLLPLAYPFPDLGKLLSLVFVVFAAWFYNRSLAFWDYPGLLSLGIFLSFGKLISAIPFLLDVYHLPDDIFNLFMTVGVLCGRFADVAGAMHLMTFTVLLSALMTGVFKIRWKRLLYTLGLGGWILVISSGVLRIYLQSESGGLNPPQAEILDMPLLNHQVDFKVVSASHPNPQVLQPEQHLLDRIRQTGIMRVGFDPDSLPFSFYNRKGQLVGFDIDLVLQLARDLNVKVEFIPYQSGFLHHQLKDDYFDIAISGISPNLDVLSSTRVLYSDSYLDVNLALVVPDYRRNDFNDLDAIRRLSPLHLAVKQDTHFVMRAQDLFPDVKLTKLESEVDFFNGSHQSGGVLLTTAEGGAAWTLIYPDYVAVNPFKIHQGSPLVIAMSEQDLVLENFISSWIKLKQTDGTITTLFDYWIMGKSHQPQRRRWNVIDSSRHRSDR